MNTKTTQAELSLTDAVHQFDAGDRDHCVAELLEPQHYSNALLDAAVVLLNQVVKSLATAPPISRAIATPLGLDRAPRDGVCGCWEAVGKWPAGATVENLALAGHLSIADSEGVGWRGQFRFLKRQLVLPVSTMSQWCVRRSSMAVVILASPKTCGQSANARLVVMSSDVFS